MANISDLNIKVSLDGGKLVVSELNKVDSGVKKTGAGATQSTSKMKKFSAGLSGAIVPALAIGAAVVGVARSMGKYVAASNVQELAETQLQAAVGKSIDEYTKYASAIQGVTTTGDEQVLSLMTLASNMGIADDQISETAKQAISLSAAFKTAGLSQETAMKGVALARQGDFTMLNRYIPALKSANTEAEKQAILQEAVARGWKLSTAEANTSAGRMKQMSNLVGDLKEQFGDFIKVVIDVIVVDLIPILTKLIAWISENKETITKTIKVVIALVKFVVKVSLSQITMAMDNFKITMNEGKAFFTDLWNYGKAIFADAETLISGIMSIIWKAIKGDFKGALAEAKNLISNTEFLSGAAEDKLIDSGKKYVKAGFDSVKKHTIDTVGDLGEDIFNAIQTPITETAKKIGKTTGEIAADAFKKEFAQNINDIPIPTGDIVDKFLKDKALSELILADEMVDGKLPVVEDNSGTEKYLEFLPQAIQLQNDATQSAERMARAIDSIGNSATSAFMSVVNGTKSASEAFKSMISDMMKQVLNMVASAAIKTFLKIVLGGATGGFGTIFASMFADGGVVEMASGGITSINGMIGGIVSQPTLVGSVGRTPAIAGEAGLEAIIPRQLWGEMGKKTNLSINVGNYLGTDSDFTDRISELIGDKLRLAESLGV